MKIAFIAAANSFHTIKWANAMVLRGHEVTVFSLANHTDQKESFLNEVAIVYLPRIGFKGYYLNAPLLKRHLRKGSFDVVNVQYASGYGTLARLAKAFPIVLSVLGSDVYEFPFKSRYHKSLVKTNLRYANVIASSSLAMAEHMKNALGVNADMEVIPFGVDTELFCYQNMPKEPDAFHIGTVKLLEPVYDIGYLLKVFSLLKQKDEFKNALYLDIYGYGSCMESLKQLSKELLIENFITFHGYIDNNQVPKALSQMDVFCLTSNMESFGVAAVEAMACEIPVVASDAEGFKEVVDNGECGFIVSKVNINEFADKIAILLHDKNLRKQFGAYGRAKVLKCYNLNKNIDDFETLLKKTAIQNKRDN